MRLLLKPDYKKQGYSDDGEGEWWSWCGIRGEKGVAAGVPDTRGSVGERVVVHVVVVEDGVEHELRAFRACRAKGFREAYPNDVSARR